MTTAQSFTDNVKASVEESKINLMEAFEHFLVTLPESERSAFLSRFIEQKAVSKEEVVNRIKKTKNGIEIARVSIPELDPQLVEKTLNTAERLVAKESRRTIVKAVLKLYGDKPFTTQAIISSLGDKVKEWEVDEVAEVNNLVKELGYHVIAKQPRQGRGRLLNVYAKAQPELNLQ